MGYRSKPRAFAGRGARLLAASGPEHVRAHHEARRGDPRAESLAHARGFPEQTSQTGAVRIHELRGFHLDVRAGADEQEQGHEERLEVEQRGHRVSTSKPCAEGRRGAFASGCLRKPSLVRSYV